MVEWRRNHSCGKGSTYQCKDGARANNTHSGSGKSRLGVRTLSRRKSGGSVGRSRSGLRSWSSFPALTWSMTMGRLWRSWSLDSGSLEIRLHTLCSLLGVEQLLIPPCGFVLLWYLQIKGHVSASWERPKSDHFRWLLLPHLPVNWDGKVREWSQVFTFSIFVGSCLFKFGLSYLGVSFALNVIRPRAIILLFQMPFGFRYWDSRDPFFVLIWIPGSLWQWPLWFNMVGVGRLQVASIGRFSRIIGDFLRIRGLS